jgi:hypothetical protein
MDVKTVLNRNRIESPARNPSPSFQPLFGHCRVSLVLGDDATATLPGNKLSGTLTPMNRIESNGHDLPPGGIELHPEIVMWTTFKGHFYLHLPTRTWMKGRTRILGNLPMEEGLTRWIANQGSYDKYLETLEKAKKRGTAVHQGIDVDGGSKRRRRGNVGAVEFGGAQVVQFCEVARWGVSPDLAPLRREAQECDPIWSFGKRFVGRC